MTDESRILPFPVKKQVSNESFIDEIVEANFRYDPDVLGWLTKQLMEIQQAGAFSVKYTCPGIGLTDEQRTAVERGVRELVDEWRAQIHGLPRVATRLAIELADLKQASRRRS